MEDYGNGTPNSKVVSLNLLVFVIWCRKGKVDCLFFTGSVISINDSNSNRIPDK